MKSEKINITNCVFFLAPSIAFCSPWVRPPINSFYLEYLAAVAAVLMIFFGVRTKGIGPAGVRVNGPKLSMLMLILIALIQLWQGNFEYSQSAMLLIFVLVLALGLMNLGQLMSINRSEAGQPAANAFVAGMVCAATLNASAGILQTAGIFFSGLNVIHLPPADRAMGFFGQSNHLGLMCVLGIVSIDMFVRQGMAKKWLAVTLIVFLFYALVLTESRGGLLGLTLWIVCSIFLDVRSKNNSRNFYWLALAMLFISVFLSSMGGSGAGGGIVQRVESISVRRDIYRAAFGLLESIPIWGVGWTNTAWIFVDKSNLQIGVINNPHVHNVFLQMFIEWGWFGLFACLICFGDFLVRGVNFFRKARADNMIAWAMGCEAVLWVASFFEYPLWYVHWLLFFSFAIGLSQESRGYLARMSTPASGTRLACVLASVCLALALVDYRKVEAAVLSMKAQSDAGEASIGLDEKMHLGLYDFNLFQGESDLILTRFMGGQQDGLSKILIEKVAHYRPFDETVARLVLSKACAGETKQAQALVNRFDRPPRPENLFPMLGVYSRSFPKCMDGIVWRDQKIDIVPR